MNTSDDTKQIWNAAYGSAFATLALTPARASYEIISTEASQIAAQAVKEASTLGSAEFASMQAESKHIHRIMDALGIPRTDQSGQIHLSSLGRLRMYLRKKEPQLMEDGY